VLGVGAKLSLPILWTAIPANQAWKEARRKESPSPDGMISRKHYRAADFQEDVQPTRLEVHPDTHPLISMSI